MTLWTFKTATAVVIAGAGILSGSTFGHVGTSTAISRAVQAPVADIAVAMPLAATSGSHLAHGGAGGNGGNGGDGGNGQAAGHCIDARPRPP